MRFEIGFVFNPVSSGGAAAQVLTEQEFFERFHRVMVNPDTIPQHFSADAITVFWVQDQIIS
ncbi:hypothetical protein D3C75_1181730 [compost metagenome]